jgi:HSP20 family protein
MIYRRYSVPTVLEEMGRMQREMNKWMGGFTFERPLGAAVFPAINAWTTDDEEVVVAQLPGVNPDEIDLSVVNDVLTISGERKTVDGVENVETRYHRRERTNGKFSRSIQLAFAVAADKITAGYEDGVLKVTLPRAEADKPRKITVQSR